MHLDLDGTPFLWGVYPNLCRDNVFIFMELNSLYLLGQEDYSIWDILKKNLGHILHSSGS